MADFGLAEDMYGTNYYRRSKSESEERVPIRWMAPESIETNIYNEATDVVSDNYRCQIGRYGLSNPSLSVVIWSDMLGGADMWWSALCWCSVHDFTD